LRAFSRCVNQPHWPKLQHRARPVHASNVGWHVSGNDAVWILSKDGLDLRLTGDGSLEAIILLALVTLVTGLGLGFFRKHHERR
jgi:hypothetical protein